MPKAVKLAPDMIETQPLPAAATPHDVLTLCAHAIAAVVPNCCEAHQDEFKAEFLGVLGDCVAIQQQEQDAADEDDDAHTSVH